MLAMNIHGAGQRPALPVPQLLEGLAAAYFRVTHYGGV